MTPQGAVQLLAQTVGPREAFTEDEIFATLAAAGLPKAVADRAYTFTQAAWGRALLDGLGIEFSPAFVAFNAAGSIVDTGKVADEAYYAAAAALAEQYRGTPGFRCLALMSSEADAVNNALSAGSKAEDLAMGPVTFFTENPTRSGFEKAQRVLSEHLAAAYPPSAPTAESTRRPWWKFW